MADTLYLLPGLLCDARVWRHQQDHLSERFDVRIPDFRLFDSLDTMAQSVLDEAPERFFLAGHSMGGRAAMQVLDKAPERVISLALLDTGIHPASAGEPEKRQVLLDLAENEGMAAVARQWAPPMVHPDRQRDSSLMDDIFEMVETYTIENFSNQVRALLTRPDAAPILAKTPPGALVLCGREDSWSPPAQHEDIARAIPGHPPVTVIEHSGHMSTMEQPEAVTKAMWAWLSHV